MKNGGGCWSVGSREGERHALLTANPSLPLVCLPFLLLPVTFLDVISAIVSPQHPPPPPAWGTALHREGWCCGGGGRRGHNITLELGWVCVEPQRCSPAHSSQEPMSKIRGLPPEVREPGPGVELGVEDGLLCQLIHSPEFNLFSDSVVFESIFVQVPLCTQGPSPHLPPTPVPQSLVPGFGPQMPWPLKAVGRRKKQGSR